jgi:uncharacterized Ntn-hydrolase superfamily protein
VAETRSPDAIQKEIEATRAELAETIDAIADRISPKRAASRGAAAVKSSVTGVFGGGTTSTGSNGHAAASVLDAPAAGASHTDTQRRQREITSVASSGGGSAYAGSSQYSIKRTLRTDRVFLAVGAATAVAAVAVLWRSRKR